MMKTARRHGLQIPSRVLGIYRALLVAEMVASELEAKVDVPSVGRAFFEQLQLDHARRALEPRNAAPTALSATAPGQLHQSCPSWPTAPSRSTSTGRGSHEPAIGGCGRSPVRS